MSKTSVFVTECSEVRREGVDSLEVISLPSDKMSNSVSLEKVTTVKKPVETTTGDSGSVSSDNQGAMEAYPTDSVEKSPTETPAKEKKGKGVRAVFRRVWKAVKRPFLCCDPNRVVPLTPQPDQEDSELIPAPSPFRITPTSDTGPVEPEPVCLPGQICEDVGPSRIEETPEMPAADLADPEPSPMEDPSASDLGDKKPKKGRKRKAVRSFFRRFRKAVKHLFPCRESKHVTPQVELDIPEPIPVQVPSKTKSEVAVPATPELSLHVSESSDSEISLDSGVRVSFFLVGKLLGSGSFGKVYEGTHIFNERIMVAIKNIKKRETDCYLDITGHSKPMLAEVAMLLKLGQAPLCPNIIQLHQWIENKSSFLLIMEYPQPCSTLNKYIMRSDNINEGKALWLIHQLVQAVKHCVDRGVFHGDIHTGNILVTDYGLELKLIDFGCARPICSEGLLSIEYRGAKLYTPPEVIMHTKFDAEPAYVWAIGIVLFEILHGYLPFRDQDEILRGYLKAKQSLSSALMLSKTNPHSPSENFTACHDLLFRCSIRNPANRLMLEHLEEHGWFNN
ncbi:Serine/threonine-protein kinase pim-1 [Labeo rohita]|uniref:non-specific serine/threonine protein kinase n=1 Tax=Labeo rohita TaxID=84645 RepID=A0ABQ8M8V8_LABRO|nr:Serine/threonine-protein kinase pim-1 [Labeo rohita]